MTILSADRSRWPLWSALPLSLATLALSFNPMASAARARRSPSRPATKPRVSSGKLGPPVLFSPNPLELGPGETDILEVKMTNPAGHATVGTLKLAETPLISITGPEWDGALPAWGAKLYLKAKAPATAPLGDKNIAVTYYVDGAGDFDTTLKYRIMTPIKAELVADYKNGAVKVRVTNLLSKRTERGRVELRSSDRLLQDQVSAMIGPIAPGATEEATIPVVKGGIAPGVAYRFDAMVATWAGYRTTFSKSLVFFHSR